MAFWFDPDLHTLQQELGRDVQAWCLLCQIKWSEENGTEGDSSWGMHELAVVFILLSNSKLDLLNKGNTVQNLFIVELCMCTWWGLYFITVRARARAFFFLCVMLRMGNIFPLSLQSWCSVITAWFFPQLSSKASVCRVWEVCQYTCRNFVSCICHMLMK
jgi:hypothetical protein